MSLQRHIVREMHDPAPNSFADEISLSRSISGNEREHFIGEQLP